MAIEVNTTFIPKKPIATALPSASISATSTHKTVGIFSLLGGILFVASVAMAGFTYFYNTQTQKVFTEKKSQIMSSQNAIDTQFLDEVKELNNRILASNGILKKHVAVSPIFQTLSDLTLKSVRYTSFEYVVNQSEKGQTIDVKLNGVAKSYTAIALQSDAFSTNKNLQDPIFSGLTLDEKGNVKFILTFSVKPEFIKYKI